MLDCGWRAVVWSVLMFCSCPLLLQCNVFLLATVVSTVQLSILPFFKSIIHHRSLCNALAVTSNRQTKRSKARRACLQHCRYRAQCALAAIVSFC